MKEAKMFPLETKTGSKKEQTEKEKALEKVAYERMIKAVNEGSVLVAGLPSKTKEDQKFKKLADLDWDFFKYADAELKKSIADCKKEYSYDNPHALVASRVIRMANLVEEELLKTKFNPEGALSGLDNVREEKDDSERKVFDSAGKLVFEESSTYDDQDEYPNVSESTSEKKGYRYNADSKVVEASYNYRQDGNYGGDDFGYKDAGYNSSRMGKREISYENGKVVRIKFEEVENLYNEMEIYTLNYEVENKIPVSFAGSFHEMKKRIVGDIIISYDAVGEIDTIKKRSRIEEIYFDGTKIDEPEEIIFDKTRDGEKNEKELK
jgi:hypothetical protein